MHVKGVDLYKNNFERLYRMYILVGAAYPQFSEGIRTS
jgi:hypothetical protein